LALMLNHDSFVKSKLELFAKSPSEYARLRFCHGYIKPYFKSDQIPGLIWVMIRSRSLLFIPSLLKLEQGKCNPIPVIQNLVLEGTPECLALVRHLLPLYPDHIYNHEYDLPYPPDCRVERHTNDPLECEVKASTVGLPNHEGPVLLQYVMTARIFLKYWSKMWEKELTRPGPSPPSIAMNRIYKFLNKLIRTTRDHFHDETMTYATIYDTPLYFAFFYALRPILGVALQNFRYSKESANLIFYPPSDHIWNHPSPIDEWHRERTKSMCDFVESYLYTGPWSYESPHYDATGITFPFINFGNLGLLGSHAIMKYLIARAFRLLSLRRMLADRTKQCESIVDDWKIEFPTDVILLIWEYVDDTQTVPEQIEKKFKNWQNEGVWTELESFLLETMPTYQLQDLTEENFRTLPRSIVVKAERNQVLEQESVLAAIQHAR